MKQEEKNLIENLFNEFKKTEKNFPERNKEAENYIQNKITNQPNSIYYIIQTVLVQESVIKNLNKKLSDIKNKKQEKKNPSFLSSTYLNQESNKKTIQPAEAHKDKEKVKNYDQPYVSQSPLNPTIHVERNNNHNNSFLGNAIQTTASVAGGVVLGNMFSSLFQHTNNSEKQVDHIIEHETFIETDKTEKQQPKFFQEDKNIDDKNTNIDESTSHNPSQQFHENSSNHSHFQNEQFYDNTNIDDEHVSTDDLFNEESSLDDDEEL